MVEDDELDEDDDDLDDDEDVECDVADDELDEDEDDEEDVVVADVVDFVVDLKFIPLVVVAVVVTMYVLETSVVSIFS